MGYRNVTCHGKTDGFGCQLNRKLSVAAYCDMHPKLRYIHHPFTDVSHGWKNLSGEINKLWLEHQNYKANNSYKLWNIIMIKSWLNYFDLK